MSEPTWPKSLETPEPSVEGDLIEQINDKEIFETKFGAVDYIKAYYPENIDSEKLLWALRMLQEQYASSSTVDIRSIVERANIEPEVAENIAIFDFQREVSRQLLQAYPQDNIKILDVGGGPTIYQHIAMSLHAGSIIHSEFLQKNRKEVSLWLDGAEGAYNWDSYFDFVRKMLKADKKYIAVLDEQMKSDDTETVSHATAVRDVLASEDVEVFKSYLRKRIKGVVQGDVFKENLGLDSAQYETVTLLGREEAVELVTSNFTIESATADREKWEQGIANVVAKVKKGGYLAMTAIRNADWYQVGKQKLPAVRVDEFNLKEILERNGFEIINIRTLKGSDQSSVGYDGMIFCFARKIQ